MDTKTALLDAAEIAARRGGSNGFSYADLSNEIGIRKASIHHHFARKDDLTAHMLDRYCDRFQMRLQEIRADSKSASEQLRLYIRAYRDALDGGQCLCLCIALVSDHDNLSETVRKRLDAFQAVSLTWLEAAFARAVCDGTVNFLHEPKAEAAAAFALVEGAQLSARISTDVTCFDEAVITFQNRLL